MSEHGDEKKTAFPPQEQQPPGLTDQMIPRPDHGEETYRGSDLLVGRKALITGGDSGIGRAVAISFAREGADVAIGYLPEEKPDASETVRLIEEAGRKAVAIAKDLTDIDACQRLVQAAVEGSAIINTSSIQAYEPSVQLLDYAATKAAVNSITVNLAEQLGPKGIRVNAVAPGPIWTPLQPATRDADKGTF